MKISSSWNVEDGRPLNTVLTIVDELPNYTNDNTHIFDALDEDKCISLRKTNSSKLMQNVNVSIDTDCCITIDALACDSEVLTIQIISEAKYVEVFVNIHQEYFKTFHGTYLYKCDESQLFQTLITLSKPLKFLSLKLKGLYCEDSVWIYSLLIKKCALKDQDTPNDEFSGSHLDNILCDKDIVLSEKAKSFRQMYEFYNTRTSSPNCINKTTSNFISQFNSLTKGCDGNIECDFKKLMLDEAIQLFRKDCDMTDYYKETLNMEPSDSKSKRYNDDHDLSRGSFDICQKPQVKNSSDVHSISSLNGQRTVSSISFEEYIYHVTESVINEKFKMFETRIQQQIEVSNQIMLDRILNLESLLAKLVDNKSSNDLR